MTQSYFYPIDATSSGNFTIQMPGAFSPFTGTWSEIMAEYPTTTGQVPAEGTDIPTPVVFLDEALIAPTLYYNTSQAIEPIPYEGQRPTWPPVQ